MAVPKRRTSRSNTRHRRANFKASPPTLIPVEIDGQIQHLPHRLVRAAARGYLDLPGYR